jgi:hypothetical protein
VSVWLKAKAGATTRIASRNSATLIFFITSPCFLRDRFPRALKNAIANLFFKSLSELTGWTQMRPPGPKSLA